jgi:hypothetical protein
MSVTEVQRSIRQTRRIRVAAVLAAALNALMLAVNVAHGSFLSLISVPFSATAFIACLSLIVWQTRLIGTYRERERELRELARPRMTPEDWRRLREMEIELGWEPSEPPADVEAPVTASPVRDDGECRCLECRKRLLLSRIKARNSAIGDRIAEVERKIDQIESGSTAPETAPAPMTGSGGRWYPVSELAEHDAVATEHFAALARVGRKSCVSYCPMCAGRAAGPGTVETMRQRLEEGSPEPEPEPPVGAYDRHFDSTGREWCRDGDGRCWIKPTPDSPWFLTRGEQ